MNRSPDARGIVTNLERGAVDEVWQQLSEGLQRSVDPERLRRWGPALDQWIGSPRTIDESMISGPGGRLAVRIELDEGQRISALELTPIVVDGIRNIVIGAPRGSWNEEEQKVEGPPRELGQFYADLLGMRILRDDWIVVGDGTGTSPRLAFGDGWSDERPPRWPDADYPHHLHIDFYTPDVDVAARRVEAGGAKLLREEADHKTFADPVGHPFCLYPDAAADARTRIGRIVFDCPDPRALAAFYAELLDMPVSLQDSEELVVIARRDRGLPHVGFQKVDPYVAPRWQDPLYPQPIHVDLHFNDHAAAKANAELLGAAPVPPPRGSCPVYTDPAGHPFCLCSNGGGDEPYVVKLFGNA